MNRRDLLRGLAGVGAGLLLPPTLADNAEAARRYWALDQTMLGGNGFPVRAGEWVTIEISTYPYRRRARLWPRAPDAADAWLDASTIRFAEERGGVMTISFPDLAIV